MGIFWQPRCSLQSNIFISKMGKEIFNLYKNFYLYKLIINW